MAIRQKPSGAWEVYYRHPVTGRRKSETYSTQKEAVQKDALIKYRIKFERSSFDVEEEVKPKKSDFLLEDVIFMYFKQKNYSKESLTNQLFFAKGWIKLIGNIPIASISTEVLAKAKIAMLEDKLRGTTIRRKFSFITALLNWAVEEGLIEEKPRNPKMPPKDTTHFVPPTRAEILQMLKVAPLHLQRVIILGFCFGARIGPCELFRLAWSDIDWDKRIVRMPSSRKNKSEPWRELPIKSELIPIMQQWLERDMMLTPAPVTVINYNGKQVGDVTRAWRITLKRAGIERKIRPYDLRHAFATEMIAAGVDIGTVAKMMGHTNPIMLLSHYQHVMDKQKKAAVELLPCVSESVCLNTQAFARIM